MQGGDGVGYLESYRTPFYDVTGYEKVFASSNYDGVRTSRIAITGYDKDKKFVTTTYQNMRMTDYPQVKYVRVSFRASENPVDFSKVTETFVSSKNIYEPYKSNILTVNEDVTLRSNGDICDELNLLTGQLTQRIGEDGVVLSQEVIKTVDLTIEDNDGNTLSKIKPIEGTMHLSTDGETIKPTFTGEIPVEAIVQNLASFIEE